MTRRTCSASSSRRAADLTLVACAAALAILIALAEPTPLHAQVATGTILGNVKDNSGAPVPTAQVTATNVDTQFSRTTSTDAEGQYALPLLPLGRYKVEVTLSGFKNFLQTGIVLEVGRNARVDATIQPGDVAEVVAVDRRRAAGRDHLRRRCRARSARTKSSICRWSTAISTRC